MDSKHTWIPFYKEMAKALLEYRDDRSTLVDWIYDSCSSLKSVSGRSLVGYLKEADGSRVKDIDPFSVFGIFNRGTVTWEKRTDILRLFKSLLRIEAEVPTDYHGIPVLDARRSFFFKWNDDEHKQIEILWSMYDKALKGEPFEDEFNSIVARDGIKYSITMALFWIDPDRYLAIDSTNRDYLRAFGMDISDMPDYSGYMSILEEVRRKMDAGTICHDSYANLSSQAWENTGKEEKTAMGSRQDSCLWMMWEDKDVIANGRICIGGSVSDTLRDYTKFATYQEMKDAVQKARGNTDVSIPYAYWRFMKEVKKGDIVVMFRNQKSGNRNHHLLLGWGRFTSDLINDTSSANPLQRTVEWVLDRTDNPVEDNLTRNNIFFHGTTKEQAAHIMDLLGIEDRSYWYAGFAFGSSDSQLERFQQECVWEGSGDEKTNELIEKVKPGDILVLKSTSTKGSRHDIPFIRLKGIGIVRRILPKTGGDYRFAVTYYMADEIDFEGSRYGKYRKTLHECTDQETIEWANGILKEAEPLSEKEMKHTKYIDYLKSNHNLILTGAPGTGKTYLAKAIAEEMGAETEFVQFHPSYDYTDFVEGLRPTTSGSFERRDGIFKEFCRKAIVNLDESMKSEDILTEERSLAERIESFLSKAIDDETEFSLKSGNRFLITDFDNKRIKVQTPDNEKVTEVVLKISEIRELLEQNVTLSNVRNIREHFGRKFNTQQDSYTFVLCSEIKKTKAQTVTTVSKVERKDFVFIIDEINRGELSKIFGELFFSIDPGYRGKRGLVKTQYQNMIEEDDEFAEGFYIPENVYILGTMNDIDRSVESMDFAMRRRFSWLEVKPEDRTEMLDGLGDDKQEAMNRMDSLNKVICATDGLGPAFQVGPAYFLKLKDGDFDKLWAMNVGPLLSEYLRGFRGADKKLEAFRDAYTMKGQGKETEDNGAELAE